MSINSSSGKLIKNLLSITSGQFINLFLSFLSITLAARYLGVENFGKFGYLLAVVSVVSKIIDFGFTPIVFRELSINKKYDLLNSAIVFRILAFFVVAVVLNIVLFFFNTSLTEQILLNLLLTNSLISARFICVRELLDVPFKVELKMHYPMLFTNIDNIVLFLTVILLPFYEDKLTLFIVGYVVSNLPGLFLTLYFLYKKFGYYLKINLSSIKYLLKESLPLYGFIVLDALYQQLDVILLKNLSTYHDAGIYSVALRLSTPLLIIPTAIIHTIFPTLSKNFINSKNDNSFIINLIFKILFILSFSISIVFFFYSKNIIMLVFG
ncbi:MAG TPA: oligosaccharide flippase family protein, partial [Melioribacteraceae bacterium]|nr:oligosaccharide flippase family protein [Melioribacteraceae bacterium]